MGKKNIDAETVEAPAEEEIPQEGVGGGLAEEPITAPADAEPESAPESGEEPRSEYPPEPTYSKHQLLEASRYTPAQKDVLSAILADYETYTIGKVDRMIADFEQRTVE